MSLSAQLDGGGRRHERNLLQRSAQRNAGGSKASALRYSWLLQDLPDVRDFADC